MFWNVYKHPRVFVNTLGRLQTPCYGQKPYNNTITKLENIYFNNAVWYVSIHMGAPIWATESPINSILINIIYGHINIFPESYLIFIHLLKVSQPPSPYFVSLRETTLQNCSF